MQAKRKLTALLLSLCMLLGMLPMTAFAAGVHGAAAFPVYAAGDAANDRFCGGCTGCANKSEAGSDSGRLKGQLG